MILKKNNGRMKHAHLTFYSRQEQAGADIGVMWCVRNNHYNKNIKLAGFATAQNPFVSIVE